MIGKFGQDFIDLEEILNFLPRWKTNKQTNFTDTKHIQVGSKSGNYFPQHFCYPQCLMSKESAKHTLRGKNSHHLVLKIKFYWNTATD